MGSGFDVASLVQMKARLEPLRNNECPFAEQPVLNGPTIWVEPEVVVEVKFQNWTDDGSLRAPVFLRLRDDVDPKRVRRPKSDPTPYPRVAPTLAQRAATEVDDIVQQLETKKGDISRSRSARTVFVSPISTACTGPPTPRSISRRSPSATCCATSRKSRLTCCRISRIARSR